MIRYRRKRTGGFFAAKNFIGQEDFFGTETCQGQEHFLFHLVDLAGGEREVYTVQSLYTQ